MGAKLLASETRVGNYTYTLYMPGTIVWLVEEHLINTGVIVIWL